MTGFLILFVNLLFQALWLAILGRVLMSWISPGRENPLTLLLFQITEPILGPLRRVIPPMGTFDLSPMVALFGIQFIREILVKSL